MAKIVTLDIENMGLLGWCWGIYEQNIIHVEHPQHLLCVSYKWLNQPVETVSIWDYPLYKKEPHNDVELAKVIWNVLDLADVVIGHNIDQFDIKMMNSMFMRHGMSPPSPYKTVDTKKVAKRYGRFPSNKLDDLGEDFGIGKKMKHQGFPLWLGCDAGIVKDQKKMVRYCEQDVKLTEKLYLHVRPWVQNHPALNVIDEKPNACPRCLKGPLHARGLTAPTKTGRKRRYVCKSCGGWSQGRNTLRSEVLYVT